MLEELFPRQDVRERLLVGPLRDFVEGYADRLVERGYAEFTSRDKLRVVAALSRWLQGKGLQASDLDDIAVAEFVREMRARGRANRNIDVNARHLLDYLRELSVVETPDSVVEDDDVSRFLQGYRKYLVQQRALAESTTVNYQKYARDFIHDGQGEVAAWLESLTADDVTEFVLKQAGRMGTRRAALMVTSLRSFLRYAFANRWTVMDLSTCVPTVPNWRLSTVPQYIGQDQVELLLASCRQETPVGLRDYAILLLMARLGLRSCEVIRLTLDDIDWQSGELLIRGKGSRLARLPLPVEVGKALVAYLQDGRPSCDTRRLFVKARAPVREFHNPSTVSTIVRRALERASLEPARKGAHLLRHSLATNMLGNGATLNEIGELLRHQQTSTTEIYAKVDIAGLRALAQPWPMPGGEQ
jgi:site-specific recombinase XerD